MEDRSGEIWPVAILFIVLSWVTVSLRIYVRAFMLKSFGLDDWTMLATLILFSIYVACQIGGVLHGTGRHVWDLEPENNMKALRFWYFCELFYILASSMLKISIGIFLLRVAVKPLHVWIIRLIMAGTVLFGTMYFLVAALQCRPVHDFWRINPGAKTCVDASVIVGTTYAAGALVSISDWTFGILPIFIVWDLKMTNRAKFLVAGILAFAAVGSTATVVRIPYVKGLGLTDDFLWTTTDIAIWSTVEPGIGITAGCIATLRPLLQLFLWKTGLSSSAPASSHLGGSKYPNSRMRASGYLRNTGDVENLRGGMVTTITGARDEKETVKSPRGWGRSKNESDEQIVLGGISKKVSVEYEETEVAPTQSFSSREQLR